MSGQQENMSREGAGWSEERVVSLLKKTLEMSCWRSALLPPISRVPALPLSLGDHGDGLIEKLETTDAVTGSRTGVRGKRERERERG